MVAENLAQTVFAGGAQGFRRETTSFLNPRGLANGIRDALEQGASNCFRSPRGVASHGGTYLIPPNRSELLAIASAFVVSLRLHWMRIAVRVAGSWVTAIDLPMLGWSLRG